MFRTLSVVISFFILCICKAQDNPPAYTDYASQLSNAGQQELEIQPPLLYQYFNLDNIDVRKQFVDTSFTASFHNYDPIRGQNQIFANLGNNGSASYSLVYNKQVARTIDFGMHQFDAYKYQLDDLKFYVVNRPVSNLFFSNQGARQNFFVSADFSRPFTDGSQLSLEYRRISQDGTYSNQNIKHTNLGLSFHFQSKSRKYQLITTLVNNVESSNNNGGITTFSDLYNSDLRTRLNVPVNLQSASTRHQERAGHIIQYLNLNSSKNGFKLRAKHHLEIGGGYFQFYDDDVNSLLDAQFYNDFLVDTRGLRFDTEFSKVSNGFFLQGVNDNALKMEAGLSYDWTGLTEQVIGENINDVFLRFRGTIPYKGQTINTKAWLGFGDANSTFNIEGDISLKYNDWVVVSGGMNIYRHRVDRVSRRLFVSETLIWDNNFSKPFGTRIFGSIRFPRLNIDVGLRQNLETNALYYNTSAQASQYSDVFSSTVIDIKHKLQFWKFGLENYAALQTFNENIYHLPTFVSRHNLYWEGYFFGRSLFGRLGLETTLVPTHDANAFMPITGQFYQSEVTTLFYPNSDIYFLAKVSDFRVFFKFENFTDFFTNEIPFYVIDHPQNDVRFRFGIRWILTD